MKTFNLFLTTDDTEHGDFYEWTKDFIGEKEYNSLLSSATTKYHPELFLRNLWKKVINKDHELRLIGIYNGKLRFNFPVDDIIGIYKDGEDTSALVDEYNASDTLSNLFKLYAMTYQVNALIQSDVTAYSVEKETGVAATTIKRQRTKKGDVNSLSIHVLQRLLTYPGLEEITEAYRKGEN